MIFKSPAVLHFNNAGRESALVEWPHGNGAVEPETMTDKNIKVFVRRTWNVFVFSNMDQPDGEMLVDDGYDCYVDAIIHATIEADKHGVGVTFC